MSTRKSHFAVRSGAIMALFICVFGQAVNADSLDRDLKRLAYFSAGGNALQSLHMVFLLHERRSHKNTECAFVGELRTINLHDREAPVRVDQIRLTDGGHLIKTHDFFSDRDDIVVQLFGKAVPESCRLTLTPTIIDDFGGTVGPVRCCGEACDCPPVTNFFFGNPGDIPLP